MKTAAQLNAEFENLWFGKSEWIIPPNLKNRKPWQKLWRLPPHLQPVLGIVYNREINERAIFIIGYDEATAKWTLNCWEDMKEYLSVTHWMPLPKLPKMKAVAAG